MRILLTSDLHYKLRQYDWLIGAAAGFDAVVVAGDHIDAFLPVPTDVQIAALTASMGAVARSSRLLVCSGKHALHRLSMVGRSAGPQRRGARAGDGGAAAQRSLGVDLPRAAARPPELDRQATLRRRRA